MFFQGGHAGNVGRDSALRKQTSDGIEYRQ